MSHEGNIQMEAPLSAPEGHVTNARLPGGRIYTGEVSEDCMHGQGTLTTDLDEHTGTFFKNLPHGHGVFRASVDPHPTGVQMYDGEWQMGERHGSGHIIWSNGDEYTGGFAHNVPHGPSGRYAFADGRVYVGDFASGVRHGSGRLTQRGGDYYEGEFVHGAMSGNGTASYAGGRRVFVGRWANGKKIKGRMTFADSHRMYDGEWLREKPHGMGEMVFANDDHYTGRFVAGQLHGVGCIEYHSLGGKVYRGTFMHDQPHGKGTITTPDGNTVEGYFRHGKQLAEDDTAAIEEVLRDIRSLGEEAAAVVNQDTVYGKSPPVSVGSTQPPSVKSSGENILEGYIPLTNGKHEKDNNKNDVNIKEDNTSDNSFNKAGILSSDMGNVTEVTMPKLPSLNPSGPLDEVKGSTSNPSKEEEKEILAVSASVISGIVPDGCKGWLEKFSIGRSRIGPSNWRRRYFILASFNTVVCLSYYKDELCHTPVTLLRLDTHDTRIVTRPSLRTHKEATKPGRDICVIYVENRKEYKLLLRADSEDEHDYWVDAFRKLFDIVDYPSDFPLLSSCPE